MKSGGAQGTSGHLLRRRAISIQATHTAQARRILEQLRGGPGKGLKPSEFFSEEMIWGTEYNVLAAIAVELGRPQPRKNAPPTALGIPMQSQAVQL